LFHIFQGTCLPNLCIQMTCSTEYEKSKHFSWRHSHNWPPIEVVKVSLDRCWLWLSNASSYTHLDLCIVKSHQKEKKMYRWRGTLTLTVFSNKIKFPKKLFIELKVCVYPIFVYNNIGSTSYPTACDRIQKLNFDFWEPPILFYATSQCFNLLIVCGPFFIQLQTLSQNN